MSWRINIGICTPWADTCWLDGKNEKKAREIIEEYAWQRPLKISYLKGTEVMLLRFIELLEEEGVDYNDVEATYQEEIKINLIGERINLKELKKRLEAK